MLSSSHGTKREAGMDNRQAAVVMNVVTQSFRCAYRAGRIIGP